MKMRKAKRTFINTPKVNRVVGRYDFSHMGFALLHEEKILYLLFWRLRTEQKPLQLFGFFGFLV